MFETKKNNNEFPLKLYTPNLKTKYNFNLYFVKNKTIVKTNLDLLLFIFKKAGKIYILTSEAS